MLDICQEEGMALQKKFEARYGAGKATFSMCDVTNKEDFASKC